MTFSERSESSPSSTSLELERTSRYVAFTETKHNEKPYGVVGQDHLLIPTSVELRGGIVSGDFLKDPDFAAKELKA